MVTGENKLVGSKVKVKKPNSYEVTILNDDITHLDFVIIVLHSVFHKDIIKAMEIAIEADKNGKARVGVYTYDMAHTKVDKAKDWATKNNFPLGFEIKEV